MLIFTNILIIAFILAMAYWMSIQGFFSAFLHLMIVLIAGTLALALYEPLVFNFGMKMQPQYAWGLWLLGPFVLLLIILRLALDRVVRKNVNFQNLFNTILGGACGIAAGVLTAGFTIFALGFLPLPQSLAGIDPYVISGGGRVERIGDGMWIPVDRIAANVFSGLSQRGFATSTPMADFQPDFAMQASLFRMGKGYDPNASILAVPGSVQVVGFHSQATPVQELDPAVALTLGGAFKNHGNRLVVVDTQWSDVPGTFDIDNTVRIPPTQIRLATVDASPGAADSEPTFHAPVGYSHLKGDQRIYHSFDAADVVAWGDRQTERFGWVFILPAEQEPRFLFVRHLRLPLPDATSDPQALAQAIGHPAPQAPEKDTASADGPGLAPGEVGGREGMLAGNTALGIENRHDLPREISKNFVQGLRTNGTGIMEGKATASRPPGSISRNTVIDSVYVASHRAGVRLQIAQDRAQSLLGEIRAAAVSLQGVWITDERGDTYQPIGYVWLKAGGEQEISVDRNAPITSARQLPIPQMKSGDELYLYFAVPKGVHIVSYNIGNTTQQKVDLIAK